MSDEKKPEPADEADVEAGIGMNAALGMVDQVGQLLEAFVVQDKYEITDIFGNSYRFRPVIPAFNQIDAALKMDAFRKLNTEGEVVQEAQKVAAEQGGAAAVLWFLSRSVTQPEVAQAVEEVFASVHADQPGWPGLLTEAQANAVTAYEEKGLDASFAPKEVLRIFPLTELVQGLLPFFVQFATRSGEIVKSLQKETALTSSPASPNRLSAN